MNEHIRKIITESFDEPFRNEEIPALLFGRKKKIDGLKNALINIVSDVVSPRTALSKENIQKALGELMRKYLPKFNKEIDQTGPEPLLKPKAFFEISSEEVKKEFMNSPYPRQIKDDLEKILSEEKAEI